METLYRKIAVKDDNPTDGKKLYLMEIIGTKNQRFPENKNEYRFWFEEIPETIKSDNTETLANALHQIEKLKGDKKELMSLLYDCKIVIDMHRQIHGFVGASEQLYEDIESLIQKMKQ